MKKIMILLVILLTGCTNRDPYVIGLNVTLTGTNASIGIQEMYGAQMAVDNINAEGGINGRQVVLEIRDDLNDPETAVLLDNELKELGVVAIIGHSFSNVAELTTQNANENDILLLSPSIGTDALNDLEDNLIRFVPSATYEANQITSKIIEAGDNHIILLYDEENFALTQYHKSSYESTLIKLGLEPISFGFKENNENDYEELLEVIRNNDITSVFIVGSSIDTSNIIQLAKNADMDLSYHLSAWASSGDIINRVKSYPEGIYFYNFFDSSFNDVYASEINQQFKERYGMDITMVASYAYDAVYLLKEAVENVEEVSTASIKEYILQVGLHEGIQADYFINEYGDVQRQIYQFTFIDGELESNK